MQRLSLKWKLLVPFLFFAFTGTTTLTFIGLNSQQSLIKQEERKMLLLHFQNFKNELDQKARHALSVAAVVAEDEDVKSLLMARDREGLFDHMNNTYVHLMREFDVSQFHFHIPPGISFLRLHDPSRFGDVLHNYRETIKEAMTRFRSVSGLEEGEAGFGLRGVVPVFHGNQLAGTVEIGHSFGRSFLEELHELWGVDMALYKIDETGPFRLVASVSQSIERPVFTGPEREAVNRAEPAIVIAPEGLEDRAILLGPVMNYSGRIVALVELSVDRSSIRQRLRNSLQLMVLVGFVGTAVSFILTYLVALLFIRPIKKIVEGAREIAEERREQYLEPGADDEIGTLTRSLNRMLAALKERRSQIEGYAKNLERRVQERTRDLVASEEKFRTLVENVPLIVYRILENGTTEFINSHLRECLGYGSDEAVGDRLFWREKVLGGDQEAFEEILEVCFGKGEELRKERVVRHKNGRLVVVIDHALPCRDDEGRVQWLDGIMMDISEIKRLQERELRTEETRLLGEISARVAHEIRNPLSIAGGFARRLNSAISEEDPNKKTAEIIVKEMSRMETFLRILLTSIQPFDLALSRIDLNRFMRAQLGQIAELAAAKGIRVEEDLDIHVPVIEGDEKRLGQAVESLLKHSVVTMVDNDTLVVQTRLLGDCVQVRFIFEGAHVSEDDLEQFFLPHLEQDPDKSVLDLPLSKIILHRHGGKIRVFREGDFLITEVELLIQPKGELTE